MSDLYIESRLQAIKDIASASCSDIKDADNIASFCDEIYSAIPNLDKIVDELEEMIHPKQLYFCKYARGGCKHLDNDDKDCMECVVENAIEIVQQGNVSDDVCEWKLEDDNLITGCGCQLIGSSRKKKQKLKEMESD